MRAYSMLGKDDKYKVSSNINRPFYIKFIITSVFLKK
jgi:hypothetical protein